MFDHETKVDVGELGSTENTWEKKQSATITKSKIKVAVKRLKWGKATGIHDIPSDLI